MHEQAIVINTQQYIRDNKDVLPLLQSIEKKLQSGDHTAGILAKLTHDWNFTMQYLESILNPEKLDDDGAFP